MHSPHNEPSLFSINVKWIFAWNWAKQSSRQGWVLHREHRKLSLAFSHCLCGCWCKGINLWPYQILAWMIVVRLFEQHRSWSVQPFYLQNHQWWKVLKTLTGWEECSRLVFSSLRPVLKELGTTKFLLQSQLYLLNQRVDLTQDRHHCAPSLDLDLADCFHPILHHFYHLHQPFLHLQTP